jgi:hypothetical protein
LGHVVLRIQVPLHRSRNGSPEDQSRRHWQQRVH